MRTEKQKRWLAGTLRSHYNRPLKVRVAGMELSIPARLNVGEDGVETVVSENGMVLIDDAEQVKRWKYGPLTPEPEAL